MGRFQVGATIARTCVAVAFVHAAAAGPPAAKDPGGSVIFRLEIPKRLLYVGESIPVDIEVGARAGLDASLDSPPTLRGDAFTLGPLDAEPEHDERVIGGKLCLLLVWHTVLSAVKPGTFELRIEAPLTVRLLSAQRPEPSFVDESAAEGPFADPAFQSLFPVATEKAVMASSAALRIEVRALPLQDRPPGFSGAVGHFAVTSEVSQSTAMAGDPLLLRLRVHGVGGFDRVTTPMVTRDAEWRAYQPRATFKPGDKAGFRGDKTFEQPVIARRPGTQHLPSLDFSYFDPDAGRYEVAHAPAITVRVVPGVLALRADHLTGPASAASLLPLYYRPGFLWATGGVALVFMAAWFGLGRRFS